MPGAVCSKCGFATLYDSDAPVFCAKCASRLRTEENLESELKKALETEDYAQRYEKLIALSEKYAGAYEIRLEILCLGRLYEKGGKPDFYRIPCWPLAAFDTPGDFPAKEREKMLRTFFDSENVRDVRALAPDGEAFWQDYLFRMSVGYVTLFIKSSNANSTFLGFRRRPDDALKRCARHLEKMIGNIGAGAYPEESIRKMLIMNLEKAFRVVFGGQDYVNALHAEKNRK